MTYHDQGLPLSQLGLYREFSRDDAIMQETYYRIYQFHKVMGTYTCFVEFWTNKVDEVVRRKERDKKGNRTRRWDIEIWDVY